MLATAVRVALGEVGPRQRLVNPSVPVVDRRGGLEHLDGVAVVAAIQGDLAQTQQSLEVPLAQLERPLEGLPGLVVPVQLAQQLAVLDEALGVIGLERSWSRWA